MDPLHRKILELLYSNYVKSPSSWTSIEPASVGAGDEAKLLYAMKRLKGQNLVEGQDVGRATWAHAKITSRGVEALKDDGFLTFLDGDDQFKILKLLHEADQKGEYVSPADVDALCIPEGRQLTCYLGSAGLAKLSHALGTDFYSARITEYGITRYESYARDGSHRVSTTSPTDGTQIMFGPNEEIEADAFFGQVVEIAAKEIVIVDAYAKPGILHTLRHVPAGVTVRILTSNKHKSAYATSPALKATVEIRVPPGKDFDFHERFIVVDGKDAYQWGHSFHDAGSTRHAVSQLRPINRDNVLSRVNAVWPSSTKVF